MWSGRCTSHPFGAAAHHLVPEDLAAVGYVEEEYFVSGTANVYEWPNAGPAVVRTPDAPYTTRILVRRPIDPADSSGSAVVEMLNPSNLFDCRHSIRSATRRSTGRTPIRSA